MDTYFIAYFAAAFTALIVIPPLSRLAAAKGITDKPGLRKVHVAPVPRLGGLGIVLGVAIVAAYFMLTSQAQLMDTRVLTILACATAVAAIGLVDDFHSLPSRTKLVVQILAAAGVCAAGVQIRYLDLGWGGIDIGWLAWPVTMLWIVGVTNAMNMIDGLDSLSGGIAAIACGALALLSALDGQPAAAVLMLAALGGLTGFLFFNFNPAKIFMGDGGTYFTGFLLASVSTLSLQGTSGGGLLLPAALALSVPLLDMTLAIARRALQRRSITAADRGHIHHRLLEKGLSHMQSALVLHAVTLLCAAVGVAIVLYRQATAPLLVLAVMILLATFSLAGALRLRDMLSLARKNFALVRESRADRRLLEEAQLRAGECTSFDDWWQVAGSLAEKMDFAGLSLSEATGRNMLAAYRCDAHEGDGADILLPVRLGSREALLLRLRLSAKGTVEGACRRAAMFARLIDDHGHEPLLWGLMSRCVKQRATRPRMLGQLQASASPRYNSTEARHKAHQPQFGTVTR